MRLSPTIIDSALTRLTESIQGGVTEKDAIASSSIEVSEIVDLVRKAATVSNAMEFIDSLPHGLATNVGSSGSQFSGGQKQRIAVARALVREPRLLLLDEATAALDSTSEQLIQSALSKASQNTTTVSIAHRLATAKDAHNIVVIQRGKVVEQGNHAGLVAQGGAYADMVSLQNLGKTSAAGSVTGDSIEKSTSNSFNELEPSDKDGGGSDTSGFDEKHPADQVPEKSEEKEASEETRSLLSTIKNSFPLIRPNLLYIFIGLATSVIIGGSYSGEAVIFGHTVGALSPCKEPFQIRDSGSLFGLLFFVLALIEFFAVIINGSAFGWAAEKILYRVRVLSLRSLLRQSLHWHSSKGRTPGVLVSHITSDATALSSLTGTTIGILFSTLVNLIAGIVVSHVVAWKISIVLLATIPVLLASGIMRLRVLAQFQERHQKAFAQATAITVEAVDNIKSVAAFSLEKQSYEVFARALKAPYQATLKSIAYGNVWLALAYSISNLVYALAYWWGAKQIMAGLYTETQFFIVLPALLFSTQSCGQMFALAPDISKARVAATNIVNLLAADSGDGDHDNSDPKGYHEPSAQALTEEKVHDVESSAESRGTPTGLLNQSGLGISLRDVKFTYPSRPDRIVLNGLNINIAPGQFCALVGPSGSGKSTTFSMFERFYRPTSGSVVIDGVDITKQSSTTFRDNIALVPQENVMFEGTVAFNIGLGARPNHEPTQSEIEDACRLANIHDTIISLPDGYDTICGQDGKQFSGGQRQRLSIARALVRKPRLLLLDESTSALDVESEKHVQESLAKVAHRTTIVAIAHRLNTIHLADRIFLIEGGRCVEAGTHSELVEKSETYRTSVVHQSLHV